MIVSNCMQINAKETILTNGSLAEGTEIEMKWVVTSNYRRASFNCSISMSKQFTLWFKIFWTGDLFFQMLRPSRNFDPRNVKIPQKRVLSGASFIKKTSVSKLCDPQKARDP